MKKEKIFISAYACEPNEGSEIGVGWNWVLQISKNFEVWALTRRSNQQNIEKWMKSQDVKPDIHFVYYDLTRALTFWKKGLRGVRLYYNLWQIFSNKLVKKTMIENDIKMYHLLTYGNVLWRASRYGMKQFFIWGPVGGVDIIPRKFSSYYGIKFQIREMVRRFIIKTLPINHGFRKKCKNANIILCKTDATINAIHPKYQNKARLFTDCAVDEKTIKEPFDVKNEKVRYLTAGRLDAWRNFDILIESFKKSYEENPNIELVIVGEGKDSDRMKKLIHIREMDEHIRMTGQLEMSDYFKEMESSNVVINPAYKESGVTMSFDALSMSKPFIGINTGGYTHVFEDGSAELIQYNEREKLIDELTKAIMKLSDQSVREEMSRKAYSVALRNTWNTKGEEICRLIEDAYKQTQE